MFLAALKKYFTFSSPRPGIGSPVPIPHPPTPLPPVVADPSDPTVAIVNVSTVVADTALATAVSALQIQLDRDFSPVWKVGAKLVAVASGTPVPADAWVIYLMDTSDQAGALGYHDLTPLGVPTGRVFAKDDQTYGLAWTVTLSHELLELLADPWIQNTVFAQDTATTGTLYALEVADAVEADVLGYLIDGVRVSDFVYPAWFEGFRPANSTKFDYTDAVSAPFQLAHGGYIGLFSVTPTTSGWTQRVAATGPGARMAHKTEAGRTARRARRGTATAKRSPRLL